MTCCLNTYLKYFRLDTSDSSELWSSDRELTFSQVVEVAGQVMPAQERQIVYLGSGWCNDVYVLNNEWILRFPRRGDVIPNLEKEVHISSVLVSAVAETGILIPDVKLVSPKVSMGFPYPIGIYPMLKGISAGLIPIPEMDWAQLVPKMGDFLSAIHSIPMSSFEGFGLPIQQSDEIDDSNLEKKKISAYLRSQNSRALDEAAEWLDFCKPLAPFSGDVCFVHNDLTPENILLDSEKGIIAGVIDWEDGAFGDPVSDFVTLPFWMGWENTFKVCESYSLSIDDTFFKRLEHKSRLASVSWLYYEVQRSDDLSSYFSYVENVWNISHSP